MKAKLTLLRNFLLASMFSIAGLNDMNYYAQNCLDPVGEDNFDLGPHENDPMQASAKIADFKANIKLKSDAEINALATAITTSAFCILKTEAIAQQATLITGSTSCSNYITGVNIILGMSPSTKKMELYYQPMVMCFTRTVSVVAGTDTCIFGEYSANYGAKYYRYTGTTFALLTVPEQSMVIESIKTYTSSIKITHYTGDQDETFQIPDSGEDATGDVTSVIYSFREINKVITDNKTTEVKIWNEVMEVTATEDGKKRRKHSLILSGKNSNGVDTKEKYMSSEFVVPSKSEAFLSAYANLAHLCPPNCNTLLYRRSCQP